MLLFLMRNRKKNTFCIKYKDIELNSHIFSKFGEKIKHQLHLFCFISNAVKKQPVDILKNFEGVAQALPNFLVKFRDPVAQIKVTHAQMKGLKQGQRLFGTFFKHLTLMISFLQQILMNKNAFMNCLAKKTNLITLMLLSNSDGVAQPLQLNRLSCLTSKKSQPVVAYKRCL